MAEFQRPPTAQEAVLVELRARILRGDLTAGAALRQEDLASSLGVSRVPVREALRMLESEGHVRYAPHRGYRVAELGAEDLAETYRLRALIEDDLARRSIATMTPEALAHLEVAHRALAALEGAATAIPFSASPQATAIPFSAPPPSTASHVSASPPPAAAIAFSAPPQATAIPVSAPPPQAAGAIGPAEARTSSSTSPTSVPSPSLAQANRAFHWAILRPGPRADRILTTLWDTSDAYRARWFADPANVTRGAHDHEAILTAVRAEDPDSVVKLLTAHREAAVQALNKTLPQTLP